MMDLDALARSLDAWVAADKTLYQRRARVLQSLWRHVRGYPIGHHAGKPLGSRLAMPWAEQTLANYLTEDIRQVIREEVLDAKRSEGKLIGRPRIFEDLLSSQPLVFNLFGMLSRDLPLASKVFAGMTSGRCRTVTRVEFEHSPGRGDHNYTGDHSAFDAYVEFKDARGRDGFVAIEVKYHEDLRNPPSTHKARYDELAARMGCFVLDRREALRSAPLQQIWRDHLLAGSLLATGRFADGLFVFLAPQANDACSEAVTAYRHQLTTFETFQYWTLEAIISAIRDHTDAEWIILLEDRYLGFSKLDDQSLMAR
jgi:hypothetical protein